VLHAAAAVYRRLTDQSEDAIEGMALMPTCQVEIEGSCVQCAQWMVVEKLNSERVWSCIRYVNGHGQLATR
jgi:hypothetical protein